MGLSAFVALAWLRMDLIMIELLLDDRNELGIYGSAQQPLEYLVIAGSIITTLSLPLMSRYYGKDPDRYLSTHRRTLEVGLGVYGLIAVMAFAVGEDVLAIPSDGEFVAAYDPLRLLTLSMMAMGTAVWHAAVLLSARLQRITIFVNVGSIVLGIVLNLLLIPRYGITGRRRPRCSPGRPQRSCPGVVAYRLTGVFPDWFRMVRIAAVILVTGAVLYGLRSIGRRLAPGRRRRSGRLRCPAGRHAERRSRLPQVGGLESSGTDQDAVDPVVAGMSVRLSRFSRLPGRFGHRPTATCRWCPS